jgi:hypothetical protein
VDEGSCGVEASARADIGCVSLLADRHQFHLGQLMPLWQPVEAIKTVARSAECIVTIRMAFALVES